MCKRLSVAMVAVSLVGCDAMMYKPFAPHPAPVQISNGPPPADDDPKLLHCQGMALHMTQQQRSNAAAGGAVVGTIIGALIGAVAAKSAGLNKHGVEHLAAFGAVNGAVDGTVAGLQWGSAEWQAEVDRCMAEN